MTPDGAALAVLYENPAWFELLFAALERRRVPYRKMPATDHVLDPAAGPLCGDIPGSGGAPELVFNRMSASAQTRGHGDTLFYAGDLLTAFELRGVPVINGTRAYAFEISKAKQLALLAALGLPFPASRVVHRADQIAAAARELRFPLVFKPNVGGRGAGIVRFDEPTALNDAAASGVLDFGSDSVALLQEYVPKRGGTITRVEIVGGTFLYAIDVRASDETFDLCPADICSVPADGRSAAVAPRVTATAAHPPAEAIADVERICREAGIEVGGVEFLVDDRDGRRLYYDINALSNFVANAVQTIGFDPWERLVDFLERRVRSGAVINN
ncbi:MAG: hypothetical protein M3R53_01575 [Candidatus Eremiobacteraeota bacterium]|nr:hypothetical protein [Candidatus Eremiobacteraeota bacterium]